MNNSPRTRTPRGQTRRSLDQLTLTVPLTINEHIDEEELIRLLTILLLYAPYARDPARFRPLLAAAIIAVANLTEP